MLSTVSYLAASGPATPDSVTDEVRLFAVGLILLYALIFERYIKKRLGTPTQFFILLAGVIVVPFLGKSPFQTSDSFIHVIHLVSLNLILFTSGLVTKFSSIRSIFRYGIIIAIGGSVIASGLIGGLFFLITSNQFLGFNSELLGQIPISLAILIGTCLGSTDAGASMAIIHKAPYKLPERVRNIIQFESSINGPSAIIAYGVATHWAIHELNINVKDMSTIMQPMTMQSISENLASLFGTGILIGMIFGYFSIWIMNNMRLRNEQLLTAGLAIACLNYAVSNYLGGAGLISAFVAGMVLSNLHNTSDQSFAVRTKDALSPFTELAEIIIFMSFATRIDPSSILSMLPFGLLCSAIMMFIARPLSIFIFQPVSPLNWREATLLSWCGIKGSVALALAYEAIDTIQSSTFYGNEVATEFATEVQSIIFIAVMANLLLQSSTIPAVARWVSRSQPEPSAQTH